MDLSTSQQHIRHIRQICVFCSLKLFSFQKADDGFDFGDRAESPDEGIDDSKDSVSIEEWVDIWGETVGRARKLDDLPMWLQVRRYLQYNTKVWIILNFSS